MLQEKKNKDRNRIKSMQDIKTEFSEEVELLKKN